MTQRALMLLLLVCAAAPPCVADDEPAPQSPIAGVWDVTRMVYGDQAVPEERIINKLFQFNHDGTLATYPSAEAYAAGEPNSTGWYALDDEDNLYFYQDLNANGELDEDEQQDVVPMVWRMTEQALFLSFVWRQEGQENVRGVVTLTAHEQ